MAELVCSVGWGDQLDFSWSLVSGEGRQDLEGSQSSGSVSVLRYQAMGGGWDRVECRAREMGGLYGQPCTYRIIIRGY